jgi:serine/threonine protein kinase/predicted RNA-binding Zn-ribbon protein involved in translation (DUF1610 family)
MSTTYQPGQRISEYLLQERIGVGSFAEVWRARHHIWDSEHVAIKLPVEPEYVRYLQREGVVVHGIKHPNVVRVLGFDPYAETPYLIMELVKGPALAQVLKENAKGLPIAVVETTLRGVLAGMVAAQANQVLHRDLKPGNVLLHLDGKALGNLTQEDVKLVDFGLGLKNVDSLRSIVQSASIDRDSKLVGTLAYMAPELRDGQQTADCRSDLYSVGVMLFEMLTGERPAGAEMPSEMRRETPPGLDAIFQRLYARYDRRYESAQAVLDELDQRMRPLRTAPPITPQGVFGGTEVVDLILDSAGRNKIEIIKLIREARPDLGLSRAHAIVDEPGQAVLERVDAFSAQRWRDVFVSHGASATIIRSSARRGIGMTVPPIPGSIPPLPGAGRVARCRSCNHTLEAEDQFCTQCGAQVVERVRRCRECGGFPGPRDQFCIFCGCPLGNAVGA